MRPFLKNNAAASVRQIGGKRRNNNYTIISRFQYEFVDLLLKINFMSLTMATSIGCFQKRPFADNSVVCYLIICISS